MLPLVTEYLLLYKRVCIPHVGTFEVVAQPAALDVADKVFTAPGYITRFNDKDVLSDHQVDFFAVCNKWDKEKPRNDLHNFGLKLKRKIQTESFDWIGFGTLRSSSNSIIFIPKQIPLESLQNLPANKVIYSNASHPVLVGDKEMTSRQVKDILKLRMVKRPLVMLIGWAIVTLGLLFLIYILYTSNFDPEGLGLKITILP